MVEQLMIWLSAWELNTVADLFLAVILGIFLMSLYEIKKGSHLPFIQFSPTLLTSMGILGTFTGISIGLVNFDFEDSVAIDNSIPLLLGGLKMAFFTSIAGMSTSLLAKSYATWKSKIKEVTEESVGALELYETLQEQNDLLEQLRKSIAGEGDASVVTQLQKVRTDVQDGMRETRNSLVGDSTVSIATQLQALGEQQVATREAIASVHTEQVKMRSAISGEEDASVVTQLQRMRNDLKDFAEKVSEIGSKQLVEALNDLIRDFNEKLTEQFGENFRRLDESVKKLVDWQDQYRLQMEVMKEEFDIAVKGIDGSRDSLQKIREEAESIPGIMEKFGSLIATNQAQLEDMERYLTAFADVRDKAVDAMPQIKEQLETTMSSMSDSVKAATDHYQLLLNESKEQNDAFTEAASDLHGQFVESVNVLQTAVSGASAEMQVFVDDTISNVSERIETAFREQNEKINQLTGALREESQRAAGELEEILNQGFQNFDRAIQDELTRVMEGMANPLTQITNKFVSDYTGFAEDMSKLINSNRRVQHEDRNA